jgi:nicotinamidase/pyrazinamidase
MSHPVSGEQAPTGLDELLKERNIERVAIVGLALDYCVKETALDAVALGYECVVPRAATAPVEVNPGDGAAAEEAMTAAGVVIT